MTAFDQAWGLLKAPYHGTTSDRVESIMREGLKPSDWKSGNRFVGGKGQYEEGKPVVFATSFPKLALKYAKMGANRASRRRAQDEGRITGNWTTATSDKTFDSKSGRPVIIEIDPSFPLRHNKEWNAYKSNVVIPPQFLRLAFESEIAPTEPITYGRMEAIVDGEYERMDPQLPRSEVKRRLASYDDDPDETGYSPELSLEEIERRVMRE